MPAKCHQGELKSKPSTVVSHLWHMWRLRPSAGVSPRDAAYRQGAQCSERESCRGDTKGSARNHDSRRYFHANKRRFLHLMRVGAGGILMEVNQGSALMSFMFLRDVHFFFFWASNYWFTAPVTSLCCVRESVGPWPSVSGRLSVCSNMLALHAACLSRVWEIQKWSYFGKS